MMKKNGFTLMELLVAVVIMTMLITMAVPLYEKTVEKSRAAEARALLKKMSDSKQRLLVSMELDDWSTIPTAFTANSLDVSTPGTPYGTGAEARLHTKYFAYRFFPAGRVSDMCARRLSGDTAGVAFWYSPGGTGGHFFCTGSNEQCAIYGMKASGSMPCN
ncbi:MAG: prepilin-type N-terminal cleavage/methylation domain-containing protein [Spirochaetota bacterium]|uniref:type IV pilin protein n=1 Tax=Candidatus Avelusimicrobium faecicola TaxID=3416205 RepID=UPI002A60CCBF|nr:prepilin-type N-terminal cleavage/methylation domain-containing protein [Spirochaetota bacterium]MDY6129645.1 prepilin-type N-terminal cleavage/methylation domain-containing protein [Elusimicrobiaceae bacterium]